MEIKEDRSIAFKPLELKIVRTREIVLEVERSYGRKDIGILWSGGKDSTILLHIIKSIYEGRIPFKVITIDTTVLFNEVYDFIKRLKDEWGFNLITLKNEDAGKVLESCKDKDRCCYLLKTKVLEDGIRNHGIKAVMSAIRWDEQTHYADEKYISKGEDHIRVNPLLHFIEKDVWEYIRRYNVPYCELYDKGYKKIICAPCAESLAVNLDQEEIINRLKSLGYF